MKQPQIFVKFMESIIIIFMKDLNPLSFVWIRVSHQIVKWSIVLDSRNDSTILHIAGHEQMETEHIFTFCNVR